MTAAPVFTSSTAGSNLKPLTSIVSPAAASWVAGDFERVVGRRRRAAKTRSKRPGRTAPGRSRRVGWKAAWGVSFARVRSPAARARGVGRGSMVSGILTARCWNLNRGDRTRLTSSPRRRRCQRTRPRRMPGARLRIPALSEVVGDDQPVVVVPVVVVPVPVVVVVVPAAAWMSWRSLL